MFLYHGTDLISAKSIYLENFINVYAGKRSSDFGPGFYMSNSRENAIRWANRKAILRQKEPAVITLDFDLEKAKEYIEFFQDDIRWARFIINNRNGLDYINAIPFKEHNLDRRYLITCGRIADKNVFDIADELCKTNTMLQDVTLLLNKTYPIQYVLHTKYSVQFVKIKGYFKC